MDCREHECSGRSGDVAETKSDRDEYARGRKSSGGCVELGGELKVEG